MRPFLPFPKEEKIKDKLLKIQEESKMLKYQKVKY